MFGSDEFLLCIRGKKRRSPRSSRALPHRGVCVQFSELSRTCASRMRQKKVDSRRSIIADCAGPLDFHCPFPRARTTLYFEKINIARQRVRAICIAICSSGCSAIRSPVPCACPIWCVESVYIGRSVLDRDASGIESRELGMFL